MVFLQPSRSACFCCCAAVVTARLKDLWTRMEPAVNTLLESQPSVTRKATFEDLLWAYSVFWSRGQSLPVPNKPGSGVHGAWLLISASLVLR